MKVYLIEFENGMIREDKAYVRIGPAKAAARRFKNAKVIEMDTVPLAEHAYNKETQKWWSINYIKRTLEAHL